MRTKLALVNYYYTELSIVSEEGGSFFRPLFFDFPQDHQAYEEPTNNVMLGSSLKLSVQTMGNKNATNFVFPAGNVFNASAQCTDGPTKGTLTSRDYQFHVHIRSGAIVPLNLQVLDRSLTNKYGVANTTYDVKNKYPMQIHIHPEPALSFNGTSGFGGSCNASGRFINDDGLTLDIDNNQNVYQFNFSSRC